MSSAPMPTITRRKKAKERRTYQQVLADAARERLEQTTATVTAWHESRARIAWAELAARAACAFSLALVLRVVIAEYGTGAAWWTVYGAMLLWVATGPWGRLREWQARRHAAWVQGVPR